MAFADERVNEVFPGSSGGVIEAVKRGVVTAFREAINGTSLSDKTSRIHVDLEYPLEEVNYPGIWVQFSLSTLRNSGMGMAIRDPDTGDLMQQMMYTGRVSLLLVALTSIERDRLADQVISMLSFSRQPSGILSEAGFMEEFSTLYKHFDENPYLSMTINSDEIRPQGQSITVGVPWDETALAYEDSYGFDVAGEFQLVTSGDGLYRLKAIEIHPDPDVGNSEGWQ